MTQAAATQAASFALAALATLAAITGVDGVDGIASRQRATSQAVAMAQAPMLTASVQGVVVVGHPDIRA